MIKNLRIFFGGLTSVVSANTFSRGLGRCKALALAFALLGLAALCSNAFAQSGAGSIQGTVIDSTGAVIPNAAIHVVNVATGVASNTKTSDIGFYQVPGLFAGTYQVTVTVPSMKTYVQTLELLAAQNAVINATMTAGAVTQQVTVSGNAVQLITTTSGAISDTLGQQEINQLPMNGRNALSLMSDMTPGMGNCNAQSDNVCPNGLQASALNILTDGVTSNTYLYGGENSSRANMTDPDSVQEVRTTTSGVGAQYGTPAVSVIQTKSGTNSLHGSLFETMQNNYFGLAKSRSDLSNFAAPHSIQNEFGASAGGPIRIPRVYNGKDKSFFFFAYERFSAVSGAPVELAVPMTSWRNGDFSNLYNGSGVLQTLYDSQTTVYCTGVGAPAPYCTQAGTWARDTYTHEYSEGPGAGPANCNGDVNCIPAANESQGGKIYNAITPLPTSATINPLVGKNIDAPDPSTEFDPQINFRLDHVFNENNRAFLRFGHTSDVSQYLRTTSEVPASLAADGFPYDAYGILNEPNVEFQTSLGYTHVFSPSFFSDTLLTGQWFGNHGGPAGPNLDYEKMLGTPNNFSTLGFPAFAGNVNDTGGTILFYGISQNVMAGSEDLTKTVGKHQLKFGARYQFIRLGLKGIQQQDTINFNGYATGLLNPSSIASNAYNATTNTGNADADLYLGGVSSYSVNLEPPYVHAHQMELDGYLQDDYRVTANLTLNLGARYQMMPAFLVTNPGAEGFDLKNDARVLSKPISTLIAEGVTTQAIITNDETDGMKFETAQQAGQNSALMKNQYLTVSPRFGFAYQLFGGTHGTVLRGSYGRYIFPLAMRGTYDGIEKMNFNNPFSASYSMSYTAANQSLDGLPSYLLRAPQTTAAQTPGITSAAGTPIMGANTTNVINTASTTSILPGSTVDFMDPHVQAQYSTEVNVSLEKALPLNSALRVSWLWTHGSYLQSEYQNNAHPSNFVYEMQTGVTPPNGGASTIGTNQYAATATGPYDQTTLGGSGYEMGTNGWSNDNQLQVNYQRLFHGGYAFTFWMVWDKALAGSSTYPYADFIGASGNLGQIAPLAGDGQDTPVIPALPPPPPAGTPKWENYRALGYYEGYTVNTAAPPLKFQWNGILDIPVGRGKHFLGNANHFFDELVGGYQIATNASSTLSQFAVASTNWGSISPIHVYKKKMPITDCTSGTCFKEYQWFNGYIAPTVNANSGCTKNCVSGLPASYQSYEVPIDNTPGTTYYGDNDVAITLLNGKTSEIAYSPGPGGNNPYGKAVLKGPFNWTEDLSLYKVFPVREGMFFRFNVDAFNVFNEQGLNTPNKTTGLSPCTESGGVGCSSYNNPRQIQLTLRYTF